MRNIYLIALLIFFSNLCNAQGCCYIYGGDIRNVDLFENIITLKYQNDCPTCKKELKITKRDIDGRQLTYKLPLLKESTQQEVSIGTEQRYKFSIICYTDTINLKVTESNTYNTITPRAKLSEATYEYISSNKNSTEYKYRLGMYPSYRMYGHVPRISISRLKLMPITISYISNLDKSYISERWNENDISLSIKAPVDSIKYLIIDILDRDLLLVKEIVIKDQVGRKKLPIINYDQVDSIARAVKEKKMIDSLQKELNTNDSLDRIVQKKLNNQDPIFFKLYRSIIKVIEDNKLDSSNIKIFEPFDIRIVNKMQNEYTAKDKYGRSNRKIAILKANSITDSLKNLGIKMIVKYKLGIYDLYDIRDYFKSFETISQRMSGIEILNFIDVSDVFLYYLSHLDQKDDDPQNFVVFFNDIHKYVALNSKKISFINSQNSPFFYTSKLKNIYNRTDLHFPLINDDYNKKYFLIVSSFYNKLPVKGCSVVYIGRGFKKISHVKKTLEKIFNNPTTPTYSILAEWPYSVWLKKAGRLSNIQDVEPKSFYEGTGFFINQKAFCLELKGLKVDVDNLNQKELFLDIEKVKKEYNGFSYKTLSFEFR